MSEFTSLTGTVCGYQCDDCGRQSAATRVPRGWIVIQSGGEKRHRCIKCRSGVVAYFEEVKADGDRRTLHTEQP